MTREVVQSFKKEIKKVVNTAKNASPSGRLVAVSTLGMYGVTIKYESHLGNLTDTEATKLRELLSKTIESI